MSIVDDHFSERLREDKERNRETIYRRLYENRGFADWIYHDVRFNCDGLAAARTAQRIRDIHAQHGKDAVFGMTGWWAMKAYWRLESAYRSKGINKAPNLLPKNVMTIMESDDAPEKKRAFITAQQFISTMTHNNPEVAEAIFNVAYEEGLECFVALMWSVLTFSIRISNLAYGIKDGKVVQL